VTAELAVTMPAVLLILAACLGGLRIGAERIRVVDAAAEASRLAARGDDPAPPAVAIGGAVGAPTRSAGTVCVTVRREVALLGLGVPITATGCALAAIEP
jgi:hypothetical protein